MHGGAAGGRPYRRHGPTQATPSASSATSPCRPLGPRHDDEHDRRHPHVPGTDDATLDDADQPHPRAGARPRRGPPPRSATGHRCCGSSPDPSPRSPPGGPSMAGLRQAGTTGRLRHLHPKVNVLHFTAGDSAARDLDLLPRHRDARVSRPGPCAHIMSSTTRRGPPPRPRPASCAGTRSGSTMSPSGSRWSSPRTAIVPGVDPTSRSSPAPPGGWAAGLVRSLAWLQCSIPTAGLRARDGELVPALPATFGVAP